MEGSSSSSRHDEDNNKKNNDDDDKKKPWSWSEHKVFALALANSPENREIWFKKIAALLTGRSLEDVIEHFSLLINDVIRIESGLTELPKYPDDDSDSDSDPQQHNRLRIGGATDEETQQSQEMKQEGTRNVEETDAERTN